MIAAHVTFEVIDENGEEVEGEYGCQEGYLEIVGKSVEDIFRVVLERIGINRLSYISFTHGIIQA